MAVAFRAVGSWENGSTGLTADEVLSVPAAQVTGDIVIVLASWKDFSITAQVSGYTEIAQFADGSTATGNGTGSMKVGAWYKVATSDTEADPTLDFSTTTNLLGEGTIIVFSKGASEVWDTPTFVTAGQSTWTTSPQTTNASSTINVKSGGAVVGLAGIRDDSATFTRATSAISDSGGLITWNGNYAESPATHASTTTGNDMAVDSGYRLVTTGANGVTLRQSCDALSAAETGALLWIVLGVHSDTTVTPTTASLTTSTFAPTVTATQNQLVTPTTASLTTATFVPVLKLLVTPTTASLTTATFAPTAQLGIRPEPTTASLTTSTFAPTVTASDNKTVTPTTLALSTATFAPTVSTTAHQTVTPTTASLATQGFAPTVSTTNHQTVVPGPLGLTLTGLAPTVTATGSEPEPPTETPRIRISKFRRRRPVVLPPVIQFDEADAYFTEFL